MQEPPTLGTSRFSPWPYARLLLTRGDPIACVANLSSFQAFPCVFCHVDETCRLVPRARTRTGGSVIAPATLYLNPLFFFFLSKDVLFAITLPPFFLGSATASVFVSFFFRGGSGRFPSHFQLPSSFPLPGFVVLLSFRLRKR